MVAGTSGQSRKNRLRFAVVLRNCRYAGRSEFDSVSPTQVAEMVRVLSVEAVLVDNLSELKTLLGLLPSSVHLVEVCNRDSQYRSIESMCAEAGFNLPVRLTPLTTCRLLLKLVDHGFGSIMEWSYGEGRFVSRPLEGIERRQRVPPVDVDRPSQLMAFLEEIGALDMNPIVIGRGKEAEVFFGISDRAYAFKVFYKFSPSTRHFRPRGLSSSDWRMPTYLSSLEFSNLRALLKAGVRVPEPIRKVGPLLVMEGIVNESLSLYPAPSLLSVDLRKVGLSPSEVFEDCLNELYHMFTRGFLIHGDFSPPNLLVGDDGIYVIDVLQGRRFSLGEATSTEVSFHEGLEVLKGDLKTLCRFFKRRYRLLPDMDSLLHEFVSAFD